MLTFLAPLAVTPWTTDLRAVGLALVLSRIAGRWRTSRCARFIPAVARGPAFRRAAARPLLGFGGWMTVSAVAGPFMVYLDRFLIGALLSLAMVAYYTTPYDLAARVLVLAQSMVGVLFPAVAADFERDPARVARLFGWGVRLIAALVFPATFLLVLFAPEGMTLWLGADFARHAAPVLRWIAAGVFLNCLGQLALSIVQASGRPRWSALLHLSELPFYLAALVLLVRARGIEGAAIAWFLRVLIDTAVMFAFAARRVEGGRRPAATAAGLGAIALAAMAAGAAIPGLPARAILAAVLLAAAACAAYRAIWIPGRSLWVALLGARAASA
jgi:O-antigen/teichoic acid export membrane protein